ncbi:MAG: methylated-DNA--[protein]-cysteine S-methyltransferase [Defluviitaleaceae bacterium]|nr:methylated-DNA--[protein]-cysteine S-methyltransferase [Defluviitaleaceae bacterium]
MTIRHEYASPIGTLFIAETDGFITELKFDAGAKYVDGSSVSEPHKTEEPSSCFAHCIRELDAYFMGELREFTVPIRAKGTTFRELIWDELIKIPYGETISYKELARRIGNPAAIRAVGGANHHNPISIIIPCHRVIGSDGGLTGYGGDLWRKEFLLKLERGVHPG